MKDKKNYQPEILSPNNEKLFRAFLEQNIDGVLLVDPELSISAFNQALEEITGISAKDIIGSKVWDLQMRMIPEERRTSKARARFKKIFLEMVKSGIIPDYIEYNESPVYREDGKKIIAEQKIFTIQSAQGNWLGVLARDTTESRNNEEKIQKQAARAEIMASFSQLLIQANQDYQLVLDTVVKKCAELIGDGASVFLYTPGSEFLELAAVYNPNPEAIELFRNEMEARPIRADEGAYGRVIESRVPELVAHIPQEMLLESSTPGRRDYYKKLPLHSMMLAPLQIQGKVIGALGLGRHEPGKNYTAEDLTFLQDLADRSALAILNARLYKELEQELVERETLIVELEKKNAQAETLRETTSIVASTLEISDAVKQILEQLKRVVRYDSASVWLYNEDTANMVGYEALPDDALDPGIYRLGPTEPDHPLRKDNTPYVLLYDIQKDYPQFREKPLNYIRAWMGIPLRARGKLVGFISLDGKSPGQFSEHDAQLTLTYANQVSIALENARLISDLQTELTERQKLIAELEEKNAELERFTYTVSHDLKSPLITINGYLGYLESDLASGNEERLRHDSQRIQEAVAKMHRLLDDLLKLSHVGRLMNPPEKIEFDELVREALDNVHGQLETHQVAINLEPNLPAVYGDRQRLVEVFQNLIENAAKFMGDQSDPKIEIGQRGKEDGMNVYFVQDNGVGIEPKFHERVFGLFDKLDSRTDGTGIGLALVKRIIETHGGRIWIESQAGNGAKFYFTLPVSQEAKSE